MNDGGVLGCVIPSSLLTFDIYSKIRNTISGTLSIIYLAKLGNFVFEDALTDVSLFIGKKPNENIIPKLIWTKNEKGNAQEALRELRRTNATNQLSINSERFSIYTPSKFPVIEKNWKILSYADNVFLKDLEIFMMAGKLSPANDIFQNKAGCIIRNKNIFKVSLIDMQASMRQNGNILDLLLLLNHLILGKLIFTNIFGSHMMKMV